MLGGNQSELLQVCSTCMCWGLQFCDRVLVAGVGGGGGGGGWRRGGGGVHQVGISTEYEVS